MEVTFHPGGERLLVTQTAEGLDPENYLSIRTHIRGQAPSIPANLTVHVAPYKELYHYADSGVEASSHEIDPGGNQPARWGGGSSE